MKAEQTIHCPGCKKGIRIALADMKGTRKCTDCGAELKFVGDGGPAFQRELDGITSKKVKV